MVALCFWPLWAGAAPLATPASVPLGDSNDRYAAGAARMVGAILDYTRWPHDKPTLSLCVVGRAVHGSQLGAITLASGRGLRRSDLAPDATTAEACDALYLGELDPPVLRRWVERARGAPIVTIAESDPSCRSEAMFCLIFGAEGLSFRLSIDAVSRSRVRIDPRVLRLSMPGY